MKKLVVLGVIAVAMMLAANVAKAADATAAGAKMGFVDLNRVLNEVPEGKAAKAKLEADGKAKKAKLEIMQGDLKKMKEDLDKQRLILSADAMKEKEGQFQQKLMELQKQSMEFERDFAEKETSAIKPISEKIQRTLQQVGQSEGYSMIVPKEMALYSLPGTDLTDKVIAAYSKSK